MQFKVLSIIASVASLALAQTYPAVTSAAPVATPAPLAPVAAANTCPCGAASAPVTSTIYSTVTTVSYVTVPASSTPAPAPAPVVSSSVVPPAPPAPYPTGGSSSAFMPTGTGVPTSYPSSTPPPMTGAASSINTNVIVAGLSAVFAAAALL